MGTAASTMTMSCHCDQIHSAATGNPYARARQLKQQHQNGSAERQRIKTVGDRRGRPALKRSTSAVVVVVKTPRLTQHISENRTRTRRSHSAPSFVCLKSTRRVVPKLATQVKDSKVWSRILFWRASSDLPVAA